MEYTNSLTAEEYSALRAAVDWFPLCREQAEDVVKNSAFNICARDGGEAVACGRVVWDGGYIAYLSDIIVRPEYQHRGIGRHIVCAAIDFTRAQLKSGYKIKLVLLASAGKEGFYESLGFTARPNDHAGAGMDMIVTL